MLTVVPPVRPMYVVRFADGTYHTMDLTSGTMAAARTANPQRASVVAREQSAADAVAAGLGGVAVAL